MTEGEQVTSFAAACDIERHPDDRVNDAIWDRMDPPERDVHGVVRKWFKSRVMWASLGCSGCWKLNHRKLRVILQDGGYYVAPYEVHVFRYQYEALRIGPYPTLEDAQNAAEILGEIKGAPT